jgi:succinoglycan biosynthesis protein ExoA
VVISDGFSRDHTRQVISAFQSTHPDFTLRVVDNAKGTIPSALNQAIRQSRGEVIVRLDAHSMPNPDYVERCVSGLESQKGENIGGVWDIQPGVDTWMARSIAAAAAHPLGVGDALYRLKPQAGSVDTVPFGSFRRGLIERIGLFDENLLTNEDYEFNTRIRRAGGTVWLDPSIRSVYFARAGLKQLVCQYGRYGFWKWHMLRRFPYSLRWRQALPPLFVLSLIVLAVLSLWIGAAFYALLAELLIYFTLLGLAGLRMAVQARRIFLLPGFPLAIAAMHLAWGTGFLWGMIAGLFVVKKNG